MNTTTMNDWNNIMNEVDAIENLGFEFLIVENRVKINHNTDHNISNVLDFHYDGTKKQAVVQAIKKFHDLY